jgi:hypothetical protein
MEEYVLGVQLFAKIINYYKKKNIYYYYNMNFVRPGSLSPTYGLGSYGRTGAAVLISSPRTKNGSQGRIYAWMKNNGQGQQYIDFLINVLARR